METSIAADAPIVTFKKRGAKANLRKRPVTPPPAASDSSEYSSSEDESGRNVKRRKKSAVVTASSSNNPKPRGQEALEPTKFAADRSGKIEVYDDATRQSNWYDETNLSAKSLLGKTRTKPDAAEFGEREALDGKYKGSSNYSNFISKNPNAPPKPVGPMKAPSNIRTVVTTDFAPDVCKDYKQTGFCGFGDNCKFLHAREDYKQGWALDKEWEVQTKGRQPGGKIVASANKSAMLSDEDEEDAALLEKIPFACVICKGDYKHPVVTKCGHYFCEKCALQRYRKKPDCAVCGAGTNGVFNGAKNLQKILDRKRKREERLKEKAETEGKDGENGS